MAGLLHLIREEAASGLIRQVRSGIPYRRLESLIALLGISRDEAAHVFGIPQRTLARRKREQRLNPEESDRVARVARIVALASDVIEDEKSAIAWMKRPNPSLGMVTPLSLLDTDFGTRHVERTLGRIEYGVYG
jgi:putative toxin-antitoxin system antitoxin component (TIGR02293 family)